MLNTINVVVIKEGVVDEIFSFSFKQRKQAEKKFLEECRNLGMDPDEVMNPDEGITFGDDVLDNGYYSIANASVCLCWAYKE